MKTHDAAVAPPTEGVSWYSAGQRLLEELNRTVTPFALATNTGVAYISGQTAFRLTACRGCFCSVCDEAASACLERPHQPERICYPINLGQGGDTTDHLVVCCRRSEAGLPAAIEYLVHSIRRQIQMEQEQDLLLEELSVSWESLEAVYEISSDSDLLGKPQELLERIINRAASFRDGLKAVLWIERGGALYPLAKGLADPSPRHSGGGVVGQVLSEQNGIILNGHSRIAALNDLEPEFRNATNLALVPLTSRHGSLGVLAVWQEEYDDFNSHNMRFLAALALQAAMVVENDRLQRAALESERLRQEMEIGSKIQQTLLVGQVPVNFPGLKVAVLTVPSQMIDGDFYDFITPHDQCLDVIIGDVMGKGIPAALVGAATKTHFLRTMSQLLSSPRRQQLPEPHEIVAGVHADLVKQLITLESFVTLCYSRFDLERGRAHIVDCGHTRTVRYHHRTGLCDLLQGVNVPIGFSERETYEQASFELELGDLFFFYSDGLTEARNKSGEPFGENRLVDLIRGCHGLDPEELVAEVRRRLIAFVGSEAFDDDLTCVAVKIMETARHKPGRKGLLELLSDPTYLKACRAFVRKFCQKTLSPAPDEEFVSRLELAVNEAVANVMEHAYAGRPDQPIQLTGEGFSDHIIFQIRHQGAPFDPRSAPAPAFDGSKDSGFGLFIIAQSVDDVSYAVDEYGWNCISLVTKLRGENQDGRNG